ncbi:protein IWS1 homolog A isoform X1 [Anopheles nili]|uniref:protein IWS1 homolog A isoform X1 n=1 Tax=Anopheles nili TaxID=185578 RepID=UPI00237AB8CA|nr:protein IWS1 homolog A isoform X1 [Anopheles nili]XP_053681417.1 protein IWS1 homolog A isoform X1 [Anopheles nili]
MRRISAWVLLGLALFTLSAAGLHVRAETPTEYECRPYIEKAIQDLKSESAEVAEENASIENTIDVTSQEEQDNTAAEEVSVEETDTATDDASEEMTPSEEVQEQLFSDNVETEDAADSEPADDDAVENAEQSEETGTEEENEAVDQDEDEAEEATEESTASEEAEPVVSEENEQTEDAAAESEELASEESANQVLEADADETDEDDDGEDEAEASEEVTQSTEETATSQEEQADSTEADEQDDDDDDDEDDEDEQDGDAVEAVEDEDVSQENEEDKEEEDEDDEQEKQVDSEEDTEDDDEEEEEGNGEEKDDEDDDDEEGKDDEDDDDDEDEESAVKGSYDDRDQRDEENVSEEENDAVSEQVDENSAEVDDETIDSSEDVSENDDANTEGTDSQEQETTTGNSDEDDEAMTEQDTPLSTEEEPEEPASEEEQDTDGSENVSEETENELDSSAPTTSEEATEADSEVEEDEQSAEAAAESQEEETPSEPLTETSEEEEEEEEEAEEREAAAEDSTEAEAVSEETPEVSEEQEEPSAEEVSVSAEQATESAEQGAEESAEEEPVAESDEVAVAEQDSTESVPEAEAEGVEQASQETETDSKEESFPEEDLLLEYQIPSNLRDTTHIYELLNINDEASAREKALHETADVILRDLKRIYDNSIKPLEALYKYRDLSNRHFGDPEIFSKPLVLFMGPWSGGKSTILNYLTHNEYTPNSVRTGAEPSPAYFNILMHGNEPEVLDGTQLAADWTFSGLQKFGQGLLDRLRGQKLPNKLLERVNIVEIPGILEVRKQVSKYFPFNDACQWFIDRADIIFLVYDPSKLDVGPETEAILDQLKGREYQTRILLNKADQVKPEELLRVQSALIWNISPLMSSAQPPVMYTVSLWSNPFEVGAPVRLLQAQERTLLLDLGQAIDRRIENKIASARRFAVRVRNHAKMVDCYLTTYYNHKTLFGNKKQISEKIIASPQDYHIYEGLSTLTNISRYDLPDPEVYRDFFHLNPLYEFKKLSETCTYFRGCPINKLDVAIAYELPELVGKYKKVAEAALAKLDVLTPTSDFSKGKSNS